MFNNCTNTRKQGEVGLGKAIAYFTSKNYVVSLPLCDNQEYDLIVDDGEKLSKVQVKTTNHKSPYGKYIAHLKVCGGNKSSNTIKKFDASSNDLLYILTSDNTEYLIPCDNVTSTNSITLGEKYKEFIC